MAAAQPYCPACMSPNQPRENFQTHSLAFPSVLGKRTDYSLNILIKLLVKIYCPGYLSRKCLFSLITTEQCNQTTSSMLQLPLKMFSEKIPLFFFFCRHIQPYLSTLVAFQFLLHSFVLSFLFPLCLFNILANNKCDVQSPKN